MRELRLYRYKMHRPMESLFLNALLYLLLAYEFLRPKRDRALPVRKRFAKKKAGKNGRGHISWITPVNL
jgi:hypothetical protein